MKGVVKLLVLSLIIMYCDESVGSVATYIYNAGAMNDYLLGLLDLTYTRSDLFRGHRFMSPSLYFLSTYMTQYPEALLACEELGGYLAEINTFREWQFVQNFLGNTMDGNSLVLISGYRTENQGDFVSSVGLDLVGLTNSYEEPSNTNRNYNNNPNPRDLYVDFHRNRPRNVANLPTCLNAEKRGNNLAMGNEQCSQPAFDKDIHRYLCEVHV